jgi:hypothetical protein
MVDVTWKEPASPTKAAASNVSANISMLFAAFSVESRTMPRSSTPPSRNSHAPSANRNHSTSPGHPSRAPAPWAAKPVPSRWKACALFGLVLALVLNADFRRFRAKVPGGDIEIERLVNEQKNQELEKLPPPKQLTAVTDQPQTAPPEGELWTRAQIEELMATMGEWGWTMGRLGLFGDSPPVPLIEWTREGVPHIVSGRASLRGEGGMRAEGTVQRGPASGS